MLVGGDVAKFVRSPNGDIRKGASFQHAASAQAKPPGGDGGHARHRLLQAEGQPAAIRKRVAPRHQSEERRHRAVGARMRMVLAKRSPGRPQAGVAARHDPGPFENEAQVSFAHAKEESARETAVRLKDAADQIPSRNVRRQAEIRRVRADVRHAASAHGPGEIAPCPANHDRRPVAVRSVDFGGHLRPCRRVGQPAAFGGGGPFLRPVGQDDVEIGSGGAERIAVGAEQQPVVHGRLHLVENRIDLVPVPASARLEMRNLRTYAGRAHKVQHLVDRLQNAVAFRAHVRGVHPAMFRGGLGEGDNFGGVGILAGLVDKSRGEAPSAIVKLARQQLLHGLEGILRGAYASIADDA